MALGAQTPSAQHLGTGGTVKCHCLQCRAELVVGRLGQNVHATRASDNSDREPNHYFHISIDFNFCTSRWRKLGRVVWSCLRQVNAVDRANAHGGLHLQVAP